MLARKSVAVVFCLSFIFGGIAKAQSVREGDAPVAISRERRADISRLLSLMKVIEEEVKSLEPMFEFFKRADPDVPAKVWEDLKKEIDAEFNAEMFLNTYVPIYARRFNATEVKELIKFFESPAGKKMVETMPLIREDLFADAYERGRKLRQRLREMLRAKGYTPSET